MIGRAAAYVVAIGLAAFALFPLAWMLLSSLKTSAGIYRFPPSYLPDGLSFGFYEKVLSTTPFLNFVANSLIVGALATLIGVAFACMAGYSLARARFRGRTLILRAILLAYLFPQILIVIPLFTAISKLGLANTYSGLILAYITFSFPFSTWMLTAYFEKIPAERSLVLPLAAPGVVTVTIFAFINAWNEFLYALVILGGGERRTLPVGLYNFVGGEFAQWGEMMAATAMTMVPSLILFLLVQKRLAGGLTAGAVRG